MFYVQVFFSARSGTRDSARGVCSLRVCGFESSSKKGGRSPAPSKRPEYRRGFCSSTKRKEKETEKKKESDQKRAIGRMHIQPASQLGGVGLPQALTSCSGASLRLLHFRVRPILPFLSFPDPPRTMQMRCTNKKMNGDKKY